MRAALARTCGSRAQLVVFARLRAPRAPARPTGKARGPGGRRGRSAAARSRIDSRRPCPPSRQERVRTAAAVGLESAERIEGGEMRGRIEQGLVFVLTVELDEIRRQVLEGAGGHELAVDEGAASALGGDLAPDDDLLVAASRRWLRLVADSSPVRTRSPEARPPSSSPTASTRMDLPAPVSPVSDVEARARTRPRPRR